jgi:hypothetical protein
MRPSETPWTIYAQEVTRKFKELEDLLATTEGNLTDWWQLMLWQRGMPNIPAVHVKLRKASREMVTPAQTDDREAVLQGPEQA